MNLGEIKTAITQRVHRNDLASRIPEFIALAEADYNLRTNSTWELASGADSAENWVSQYAPMVYIAGGMFHIALETHDDNLLAKWSPLFDRAVSEAHYGELRDQGVIDQPLETELVMTVSSNILEG